jgi:signal transduction histidine kinase
MTLNQKNGKSPLAPFLYCAAITIALLSVGGGVFGNRYVEMVKLETMTARLIHLDGVIRRIDETTTMSAKMAAATGDPRWEQRFQQAELPLAAAVEELLSLAPESAMRAVQRANVAEVALDATENRAIQLSRNGELAAASAMFDAAYDEQRRLYSSEMDASMEIISREASEGVAVRQRTMTVAVCVGGAALVLLVLLWLHMLRLIRRYIQARTEAEGALLKERASLETRVEQRTQEVAASREQYRFLIENIDAVPFEWDPATHKMLYIAPQAAKLLECPLEALQDESLLDKVLHNDDRDRFRDRIDTFTAGTTACTIDFRVVTNTRRTLTIRMSLSARGHGQASYGVMLDITKQAQLELEFQQSLKLESVGRLAAGVAHEINTPIQFVTDSVQFVREAMVDFMTVVGKHRKATEESLAGRSAAGLAREAMTAEEEVDMPYLANQVPEAIERSLSGLSRVAQIVRSMKVFSHPDQADMMPVSINESIGSTLVIAENEYKYAAELKADFGELPAVTCFAGELNQVFLNLLINAAHAVGDTMAKTNARGLITVTTRRDNDHVVILIADTGSGIPVGIRERVFDPFFTTKEVGKGTGQGLSHARMVIVDKHHGTLTFETTTGVGTTFCIRIPIDGTAPLELAA